METTSLYTILSFILFLLAVFKFSTTRKWKLPPSPLLTLPIIGHLYLLKMPIHRTYRELSKKLGPIFSLSVGSRRIVVVASSSLVEECFVKNDVVLANRPHFIVNEHFGYNFTNLLDAPYGEHWRNLRRIFMTEVLSTYRLKMSEDARRDEVKLLLEKLYKTSANDVVELKHELSALTFNVVMRMISGKRFYGENDTDQEKEFQKNVDEMFKLAGATNPADFIPLLRRIDFNGQETHLARSSKIIDALFQSLIDNSSGGDTMIDHLLILQKTEPDYYSDIIIKGIIAVILLVGTDTTSITMEWAMAALLNNPEALHKARAEIDTVVGNNRLVNESDIPKLPYLDNIISETFRLFPAAPLLVPHEPSADCKIGGYDVPKGTILMVNAWDIHRDPKIWEDPESFKPERFDQAGGKKSELIHFGIGRRSCPGSGLSLRLLALTLASLIQCFEWERISDELVDMTEGEGITMPRAIPLQAICKPRQLLHTLL